MSLSSELCFIWYQIQGRRFARYCSWTVSRDFKDVHVVIHTAASIPIVIFIAIMLHVREIDSHWGAIEWALNAIRQADEASIKTVTTSAIIPVLNSNGSVRQM